MKISLFAAAIKPWLWMNLLDSLKSNTVEYEVVFAGPIQEDIVKTVTDQYPELKYITTGNIKPSQAYAIALNACKGELVCWISDDCTFSEGALDKIVDYDNTQVNHTYILALKNFDPECAVNDLNDQRFFPQNYNTPLVATIGVIGRKWLIEGLKGLDSRYFYGKWEVDICMRNAQTGGKTLPFEDVTVNIEHTDKKWHLSNDWSGVNEDSETLENSWVVDGYQPLERGLVVYKNGQPDIYYPIINREVSKVQLDKFKPFDFSDPDILIKSQNGKDRWD